MIMAKSILTYFSPKGGCTDKIIAEISKSKKSLDVQAFTFTSAAIAKSIIDATKRGIVVRLILDSGELTDKYSSVSFFNNLGLDVMIDKVHAIAHNKIIIIDGKILITGSFNFTKNAESSNAENLLVIRNMQYVVDAYKINFETHYKHSIPYKSIVAPTAPI